MPFHGRRTIGLVAGIVASVVLTPAAPFRRRRPPPRYLVHGSSQNGYGRQTRYDSLPLSLA